MNRKLYVVSIHCLGGFSTQAVGYFTESNSAIELRDKLDRIFSDSPGHFEAVLDEVLEEYGE